MPKKKANAFNPMQIKNDMIVRLNKDGTFKAAWDRKTGDPIKINKFGQRI
jgi:hypothetical protein